MPATLDGDRTRRVVPALMDRLGLARLTWSGTAWAARSASVAAAEEPERVDRLVLIDAAGFNLAPADRPWMLRVVGAPAVAAMIERLPVRAAPASPLACARCSTTTRW